MAFHSRPRLSWSVCSNSFLLLLLLLYTASSKKNHATKHALKHYSRHKGNIVVFWYTRAYVDRRRIRALLNRFFAFIFRTQIVGKCQSPPCPRPARTCMRASISDRESEGRKWRRFTEPWTTIEAGYYRCPPASVTHFLRIRALSMSVCDKLDQVFRCLCDFFLPLRAR